MTEIAKIAYELILCSFSAPLQYTSVSQWTLNKDAASPQPPQDSRSSTLSYVAAL